MPGFTMAAVSGLVDALRLAASDCANFSRRFREAFGYPATALRRGNAVTAANDSERLLLAGT
jgi:transcriptional regulator GlxA family with amidase domain